MDGDPNKKGGLWTAPSTAQLTHVEKPIRAVTHFTEISSTSNTSREPAEIAP